MNTLPLSQPFAELPASLHRPATPSAVPDPRIVHLNEGLCAELGVDPEKLRTPEGVALLAGNAVPDGVSPLSTAYAGHQFGGFVPVLGDGRAILLGSVIAPDRSSWEIQLKGAGRTPFSRGGSDGRAWLGPVLREYVLSEAMHVLGIPTTRALAAISTGRAVLRERPWPGGVIVRVARSHLRVGTFEYLAHRGETESIGTLVDHVLAEHYPELEPGERPAATLLAAVRDRQAGLVARWLAVGFIHGVMNTDNCSVAGLTIDYGPCAFLDAYDPDKVFSSIDHMGRYRYAHQPPIAAWNLGVLAHALLPHLESADEAREILGGFGDRFAAAWEDQMRAKLGLAAPREGDGALASALLDAMALSGADFTRSFRSLASLDRAPGSADAAFEAEVGRQDDWLARWRARLAEETRSDAERKAAMRRTNPAYIPRNHRIEEMITAAVGGDLAPLNTLVAALADPFEDRPEHAHLALAPRPEERVIHTFCGT